jgi:hypothetical protein
VPSGYDSHLYVVNNTILNDLTSGTFVNNASATGAVLTNNIFYNGGTVSANALDVATSNFDSSMGDPMFTDAAMFDVTLAAGSPCIDTGAAPGVGQSQALAPAYEYVQPVDEEPRGVVGKAIDIGAYEHGNVADAGVTPLPDGGPAGGVDASQATKDAGAKKVDSGAKADGGKSGGAGEDGGAGAGGGADAGATVAQSSGCALAPAAGRFRWDAAGIGALASLLVLARRRRRSQLD